MCGQVVELHQDECVLVAQSGMWAPPEAVSSVTLSHPNLVRTYKYAVAQHPAPNTPQGKAPSFSPCCLGMALLRAILGGCLTYDRS